MPISDYIWYLEKSLGENEYAVLAVTDHNVIPLTTEECFNLSTQRVIVVPGIEWTVHKTLLDSLTKLCTRRELITLGDMDDLRTFILENTAYSVQTDGTLTGRLRENEVLDYVATHKNIAIVVPHPAHFFVEYYGQKTIKELFGQLQTRKIENPFFVEEKGGYDPFPRIFYSYRGKYPILGGSDAHRLFSYFNISAVFSVETSLDNVDEFSKEWDTAIEKKNLEKYRAVINELFSLLIRENESLVIEKHKFSSVVSFSRSIPGFIHNRFVDFPNRVLK